MEPCYGLVPVMYVQPPWGSTVYMHMEPLQHVHRAVYVFLILYDTYFSQPVYFTDDIVTSDGLSSQNKKSGDATHELLFIPVPQVG